MREEIGRLLWRGAEEGLRLTAAGVKLALERAEAAGLLDGGPLGRARDTGDGDRWAPAEAGPPLDGLYEGRVEVEVGPLEKFSQLVELEDAANSIGAAGGIRVERFSGGRATLSLDLATPTDLLHELETRFPSELTIRKTTADRVVLDLPDTQDS